MKTTLIGCTVALGLLLTACGNDGSLSENDKPTAEINKTKETIALDNVGNEVRGKFIGYEVVVYSKKKLSGNPSPSSKAIYGNINGKSTESLLSINDNYTDGDVFWIKIFDGDELVGQSDEAVLDGEALEFSDVEIGGER